MGNFMKLRIWQNAKEIAVKIYHLTCRAPHAACRVPFYSPLYFVPEKQPFMLKFSLNNKLSE
jgi:hypothetical protein